MSIESFDLTRLLTVESEQGWEFCLRAWEQETGRLVLAGEVDLAAVPESHAAAHEHSHDHSHSNSANLGVFVKVTTSMPCYAGCPEE